MQDKQYKIFSKVVPYEILNEGMQQIQREDSTRIGMWDYLTDELECWACPRTVDIWAGEGGEHFQEEQP